LTIQWYPGHMTKAKRMLQQELKTVDAALELVDARIPASSRNPDLEELITKPRLMILTKSDLADPQLTDAWIEHYKKNGESVIPVDLSGGQAVAEIARAVKSMFPSMRRDPRVMVVGVPNVGKSTLINRIARRKGAKVGARPGVTRGKQWIRGSGLQLLDSPGILWPKFEDQEIARKLAVTAAIRDEVLDQAELAIWLLTFLHEYYPQNLTERYGELSVPDETNPLDSGSLWMLEEIGKKRGCLRSGGVVDLDQAAVVVLTDFRTGRLGRLTLDRLEENNNASN